MSRPEGNCDAGVDASVGSVGDGYDNALAETTIGLYKAEKINREGPWPHPRRGRTRDPGMGRLVQPHAPALSPRRPAPRSSSRNWLTNNNINYKINNNCLYETRDGSVASSLGRQADEKLPEAVGAAASLLLRSTVLPRPPAHAAALWFLRLRRWAISSREMVGLYVHER